VETSRVGEETISRKPGQNPFNTRRRESIFEKAIGDGETENESRDSEEKKKSARREIVQFASW